jgi:hypothetical protein
MPKISQLTEKTTFPSDTDLKVIVETSTSTTKKITWLTIKNALKNFFDGIYASLTSFNNLQSDYTSHKNATSGVHGVTGSLVGTTDSQTLSNKNPVVNINFQTGTSYTLVLTDAGQWVAINNANANTVTIPTNATVAFPVGTKITIQKYGAGNTTIQAASGVTLRDPNNAATITTQYDVRVIVKTGTDEWVII